MAEKSAPLKVTKRTQEEYRKLLNKIGEEEFFKFAIINALKKRIDYEYEEVYLLDLSDAFFGINRQDPDEEIFKIGKILRKAAQKMYTEKRKLNKKYPIINRFLNVVK